MVLMSLGGGRFSHVDILGSLFSQKLVLRHREETESTPEMIFKVVFAVNLNE